ncbi:MAG: SH3 beta-barrel fold-containing protein [Thermodesulfobacteriota bacterium]|nr:SH3 beta-barrel fold-containing protein [Thermodesulfobacteriota bacterium]
MADIRNISRMKLESLIESSNGKTFYVRFTKVDGSLRKMRARLGVEEGLKGGVNRVVREDNAYMTVFDTEKGAYRTLNLETVSTLKIEGERYRVV